MFEGVGLFGGLLVGLWQRIAGRHGRCDNSKDCT